MQTWGINLSSGLMAPGRWLSAHRPTDKYKEVRGAHQTADGSIWLRSEVNHHPGHPPDVDEVTVLSAVN